MNRMRAEQEAARRNHDKAMRASGLSYAASQRLNAFNPTQEGDWCVVTFKNGKPIEMEY